MDLAAIFAVTCQRLPNVRKLRHDDIRDRPKAEGE